MGNAAGLSTVGLFHTVIGLAALVAGVLALVKDREIRLDDRYGRTYLLLTLITAAVSLAIFRHGTFGVPHVLAILTLLSLGIGYAAAKWHAFGGASRYVQAACFTTTILFHLIPGVTETSIRLPLGHPFAESPDAATDPSRVNSGVDHRSRAAVALVARARGGRGGPCDGRVGCA